METLMLHNIPKKELNDTVRDFQDDGYTVTTQQQDNKKYTIVAVRPQRGDGAAASGGNVVVLHNVPPGELAEVVQDLTDDGYAVTVEPEDDGEFTVIGVKR